MGFRRIEVKDVRAGMIVTRTDKQGIRFGFYGHPVKDAKAVIRELMQADVKQVYIKTDGEGAITNLPADAEDQIARNAAKLMNMDVTKHAMNPETPTSPTDAAINEADARLSDEHEAESLERELTRKVLEEVERMDVFMYSESPEEIEELKHYYVEAKNATRQLMTEFKKSGTVNLPIAHSIVNRLVSMNINNSSVAVTLHRLKGFDEYTFEHSLNVCLLSIALGKRLGMNFNEMQDLGLSALLHDVGMLRVPDHILRKPGRLTDEEFKLIRKHPLLGYDLLKKNDEISKPVLAGILQHHERSDGSGYPQGVQERDISKFGKIIGIIDVFDAITSDRSYNQGIPPAEALKMIFSWSGKQFNQALVKFFVNVIGVYPVGTLVVLDSGELAIVMEINRDSMTRPRVLVVSDHEKKSVRPHFFDLVDHDVATNEYYKKIVSPINPKFYNIDVHKYLTEYRVNH